MIQNILEGYWEMTLNARERDYTAVPEEMFEYTMSEQLNH